MVIRPEVVVTSALPVMASAAIWPETVLAASEPSSPVTVTSADAVVTQPCDPAGSVTETSRPLLKRIQLYRRGSTISRRPSAKSTLTSAASSSPCWPSLAGRMSTVTVWVGPAVMRTLPAVTSTSRSIGSVAGKSHCGMSLAPLLGELAACVAGDAVTAGPGTLGSGRGSLADGFQRADGGVGKPGVDRQPGGGCLRLDLDFECFGQPQGDACRPCLVGGWLLGGSGGRLVVLRVDRGDHELGLAAAQPDVD